MKRLALFLACLLSASCGVAASSYLLPGSINFNSPGLWGKTVCYGLDDNGNMTGTRRWYTTGDEEALAMIFQYPGKTSGYMVTDADGEVYRTVSPLVASTGPEPSDGKEISVNGIYLDTKLTVKGYLDESMAMSTIDDQDKLVFWLSTPENGPTNFMVTAGVLDDDGKVTTKHYKTTVDVKPGVEFQLTVKALTGAFLESPLHIGFEIYINGARLTATDDDGTETTLFPSRVAPDDKQGYGEKIYSFAVTGASTVDKINFSTVSPQDYPDYDKDDVTMLRECATVTISGYPESGGGLTNFPVLVRISEASVKNFRYARTATNGTDIRFTDENGTLVPCEVDTWNPEGESLIWVKVPYFRTGATLTMHWSLKTGASAPSNDSTDVWSEYLAVWHMSKEANTGAISRRDSTKNGHTLTGGALTDAGESIVGAAGVATGDLVTKFCDETSTGNRTTLTFTGWYRAASYGNDCRMITGTKYGAANHNQMATWPGWDLHFNYESYSRRLYQNTDGQENYQTLSVDPINNWAFYGFSVGVNGDTDKTGTRRYFCAETTLGSSHVATVSDANRYVTITTNNFLAIASGFLADELRVTRQVRSVDWVKTEHDMLAQSGYVVTGYASVKGTDNYWIENPEIRPSPAVSVEEAKTVEIFAGTPRFGTSYLQFFDRDGNMLGSQPTTPGTYHIVALVSAGLKDGLRSEMTYVIYDPQAYRKIGGYDRIMLFNSDLTPGAEVSYQGYSDVGLLTNEVWSSTGDAWAGTGRFVKDGTTHVYSDPETGNELWVFRHARLGNLFPDDKTLTEGMHYLPWGGNACRFDDSEKRANAQRYAGALILQNADDADEPAQAISPRYEDGIGTVYFDAVNAYMAYTGTLKIQVTTSPAPIEKIQEEAWVDVAADVFAIRGGVYDEALSTNDVREINLAMAESAGTTDCFYRVRARIDTNMPVRVRLVRTDTNYDPAYEGNEAYRDAAGLVEVDNIIVSYPAMGAKIRQYGAPNDDSDLTFRGWRAPFDIPFPCVADLPNLHGQVKVDYLVNNTNTSDASFLGAVLMKYRWRYLNQSVNDWKEIVLLPSADDETRFVSSEPLSGAGLGDIEYNYTAVVNAPFYEYVDYSGLAGWVWPDGVTERRGDEKINAQADGLYLESKSPALGVDYFVRLREGASDYERFRLHVRPADSSEGDEETVIEMTLSANHTWRGLCPTKTALEGGLRYRLEAVNRQTQVGGDYQWTTNWFRGEDKTEIPANDVFEERDGWATVPCDGVTGYLLFQIEDDTRSLAIIHADHQNFNAWTDANLADGDLNGHFVGSSQDGSLTSGVSRAVQSFTGRFANLYLSSATNRYWIEDFTTDAPEEWDLNVPFSGSRTTPRAWTAQNGMFVCPQFNEYSDSIALQLKGEGYGILQFPQTLKGAAIPRGIEKFDYAARVAQTYDIHSFSYYSGGTNDAYRLRNYTFAINCVMSLTNKTDFTGMGSVSLVSNFRDSKGGYEVRLERMAQKTVRLSLYKWFADGTSECLGYSDPYDETKYSYSKLGLSGDVLGKTGDTCFGSLFLSCEETTDARMRIVAGVCSSGAEVGSDRFFGGNTYLKVCYEESADPSAFHVAGTFGVGSRDCPAVFTRPILATNTVAWATDWDGGTMHDSFHWWKTPKLVSLPDIEHPVLSTEAEYENWNIYTRRLSAFAYESMGSELPYYGFRASTPAQAVIVETSPRLAGNWTVAAINLVDSFSWEYFSDTLHIAEDSDVRIRTSSEQGGGDVVIGYAGVSQWRGEDYDLNNAAKFYDYQYGSPTNFVFTSAWIGSASEIELAPMRAEADYPCGIRAPLMDGLNGRGIGLGLISFAYRDADRKTRLLVQIATNKVTRGGLYNLTQEMTGWQTVETIDFDDAALTDDDLANGVRSCYLGIHGVTGVMRVILDPVRVSEAHDSAVNTSNRVDYGRIFITMATAKDNPSLDTGSWWGWNLRTTDDLQKLQLNDGSLSDTSARGLSYGLNNSVTDDVRADEVYNLHKPFLQTPIFVKGVIGEVMFKARRYSAGDDSPTVAIYGTTSLNPESEDADFEYLGEVLITSDRFETYSFQAPLGKNFSALRLAVTGVEGVTGERGPLPSSGNVRRVLLDEVTVCEAIRARLGFHNTGAFRSYLGNQKTIYDFPRKDEQPLCGEPWGVQTELYAAQLSEKIDLATPGREPKVTFHWYVGTSPWGYYNWMTNSDAHAGELLRTVDSTGLVYRASQLKTPEAVVPLEQTPGTIVQYSLEVVYYMLGQDEPLTNVLTSVDWTKPSWYEPVDCNAEYGNGTFAAYNILDSVAPGWAWLNEINLFGDYDENWNNTDEDCQYVEVAVPSEADLTDWSIRMLVAETGSLTVRTNTVATFGTPELEATKKDLLGQASGMVFRVVASRKTYTGMKLKKSDGTLDGVWSFDDPDGTVLLGSGDISEDSAFGIQLVRGSGIVEHEIVVMGTNFYGGGRYAAAYHPSNTVNFLNKYMTGAHFFHAGDDDGGLSESLSVFDSRGEASNFWDRAMIHTPGRINTYRDGTPQILPSTHPTPLGTSIFIYANLGDSGRIRQTVGEGVDTTADQVLMIQRGSLIGTDITYRIDRWHELGTVTTNGGPYLARKKVAGEDRTWRVTVGVNASNNITVVANAQVCETLRQAGVDENNRYTPAIVDWFEKGTDMFGNKWPETENDEIYLAKFLPYCRSIDNATNMTLKQMYWLDMCPTVSNQFFIAGFCEEPDWNVQRKASELGFAGDAVYTNRQVTMFMAISNGLARTVEGESKTMYPPYVVRGVDVGSSSWDYAAGKMQGNWSNATFKITGRLINDNKTGLHLNLRTSWVPLRWFVFDRDSFPTSGENAFKASYEVWDPYSPLSPAYPNWHDWIERNGWVPEVWHCWELDEQQQPFGVEVQKPVNDFVEEQTTRK